MISRPKQAFFSVILLAAGLIAGCQTRSATPMPTLVATLGVTTPTPAGTSSAATATPSAPATPTVLSPDASLQGKTIVFWHPWSGELEKRVGAAVAEFNRDNSWGIKVKAVSQYNAGALYETLQTGLQGDPAALPQVVAAASDQLASWQGNLADLTGYIANPQVGMSETEIKAFAPPFWNQDAVDGHRLGIPALRTGQVIYYNLTWAKDLGFNSPPATPEDFKQQACAAARFNNDLRSKSMNGTGGWLVDDGPLTMLSWLSAFGAKAVPDSANEPYTFESPAGEKAVTYLRGLYDQGCAWVGRNPEPYDYFTQRMTLFYTGSLSEAAAQASALEQAKSTDQWTVLPFPTEDGQGLVYTGGYSYAVLKSADPQTELAAWLFVRWMAQPGIAVKLAEAQPSLPVSSGIVTQLGTNTGIFPWKLALPLVDKARPAPALASWRQVRRLLQDAAWQIYHLPAEGLEKVLPQTLPQLDQAIKDLAEPTSQP